MYYSKGDSVTYILLLFFWSDRYSGYCSKLVYMIKSIGQKTLGLERRHSDESVVIENGEIIERRYMIQAIMRV